MKTPCAMSDGILDMGPPLDCSSCRMDFVRVSIVTPRYRRCAVLGFGYLAVITLPKKKRERMVMISSEEI